MALHGFDVYRKYLAFKQHFTNPKFDYFQYDGKVNAKEETYQQRPDFYFFETLARKLTEKEVDEYMFANFSSAEDPKKLWIGDIKRSGRDRWLAFQKRQQSLSYLVSQDLTRLADYLATTGNPFNSLFETVGGHPIALKLFIKRQIHLDTLIILDMVLGFSVKWDEEMRDPLWTELSFKIKKIKPFMSIPVSKYKSMMKETFL